MSKPISTEHSRAPLIEVVPPKTLTTAMTELDEPLPMTWPHDFAVTNSQQSAFADLAKLWEITYDPQREDYCSSVREEGIECLARTDSIEFIRKIGRPVILRLYDDSGRPFHVALARLERNNALFVAGKELYELNIAALTPRWFGDYLVLWKPPEIAQRILRLGESGEAVGWLAKTLEKLHLYQMAGSEGAETESARRKVMSFILEALKNSEEEREQKVPKAQTVRRRTLSFQSHRPNSRPFLIAIVCLFLVLLAFFFIDIKKNESLETAISVIESRPGICEDGSEEYKVEASSSDIHAELTPVPRPFARREPVKQDEPLDLEAGFTVAEDPHSEDQELRSSNSLDSKESSPLVNSLPQEIFSVKVQSYQELNLEIRNQIPRLDLSMHFYTEVPERRLVRINNHLLHEGDRGSDDLTIQEIIPEGVIIDFRGNSSF